MAKPQTRQEWLFFHALTTLPIGVWAFIYSIRPYFYDLHCAVEPSPCTKESVFFVDQIVFRFGDIAYDALSNWVQNITGLFVFLIPVILYRLKPSYGKSRAFFDVLSIGQATFWNGVIMEIVRMLVQRPRPGVFNSPITEGLNLQQYSSFYSGHTSFVALATTSAVIVLSRVPIGTIKLRLATLVAVSLTLWTGVLRVLGGRHYPTDVLVGAIMGMTIALTIQSLQKRFRN